MDTVNELGKSLNKIAKNAKQAVEKQSAEYPMTETVRDIFDSIVAYRAHFFVPRKGMSITTDLQFELPPPLGSGNCCGDCFCTACEVYSTSDFADYVGYTSYPYLPGTLRIVDSHKPLNSAVNETDPASGIFTLGYDPDTSSSSYVLYACYIYQYDGHCTTNPTEPTEVLIYGQGMAQIS
jgi:hypothetical protein